MIQVDLVLIVDNNGSRVASIKRRLEEQTSAQTYRVAVNGEHALLCLDHFELCSTMRGKKVIVVLNLETPMVDGLYFLDKLKDRTYSSREKIAVLALEEATSSEQLAIAKNKGIFGTLSSDYNFSSLNDSLSVFFSDKETKFRMPELPKNLPISI